MTIKNNQKLAVFDIDGTLFRSSLLIELTNLLVAKKIFPISAYKEIEGDYINWLNREAGYENYIGKVVRVYEKNIVGKSEKDIEKAVKEVLKEEKKKLYRYTRHLIKKLKSENYFLFAISGSPGHILTSFAKDIGFDKYLGGFYEVIDGKFTGKQPYGNPANDKKKTLLNFLEKYNHLEFDLKKAIGIGDTESDIAFLEMLGNPIAFNPNRKLAEYAKKNKWRVIVERKDVIYDISQLKFIDYP